MRREAAALLVALAAFALAPTGGAQEQGAGCCYDAQVQGGFDRVTNSAALVWRVPYPDLVTSSVEIGTTIAASGYLADDAAELAYAGTGPVTIGTPTFPIDAYVYAQIRFRCAPADPAHPACGPIPLRAGQTVVSLPAELEAPVGDPQGEYPQDFTLSSSADGSSLQVATGGSATATVWIVPEYGFYDTVAFSASAPPGLAVSLAPQASRSGTTMTITAAPGTPAGGYTVALGGTSGPLAHGDPVAVTVVRTAPPPTTTTTSTEPAPKPRFRLTVRRSGTGRGTVTGGGLSCGTRCSTTVTPGTVLLLKARPALGSAFSRWSGACGGKRPSCTLRLSAPASVTASFAKRQP